MRAKLLLLVFGVVLAISARAQQNSRSEKDTATVIPHESPKLSIYKDQLDAFVAAFEQKFSGNSTSLDSFYFSRPEADILSVRLQNVKYPEVDSTLALTILDKNEQVRSLIDSNALKYTSSKHIKTTYRRGYTNDVEGFLMVFSLGDETGLKETMSLLLIISEKKIKILSLKEEK